VSKAVPPEAVLAILERAIGSLHWEQPGDAALLVTTKSWRRGVESYLPKAGQLLFESEGDSVRGASSPRELAGACHRLVLAANGVSSQLGLLSSLKSGHERTIAELSEACRERVRFQLNPATPGTTRTLRVTEANIRELWGQIERSEVDTEDAVYAVFGVPTPALVDDRGVVSAVRLIPEFYQRYSELDALVNDHLAPLTSGVIPFPRNLELLVPALTTEFQAEVSLAASGVKAMLLRHADAAEDRFGGIRQITDRVDASATNHEGTIQLASQLRNLESSMDRTLLALELYRRVVEGQLRPWVWALLRLMGRQGDQAPMLSRLKEQARSERLLVLQLAADLIHVEARNAAAHESAEWDPHTEMIKVGEDCLGESGLTDMYARSYAFMVGCELGLSLAVAESNELASRLASGKMSGDSWAFSRQQATRLLATNGLHVRRWRLDGSTVKVWLDQLTLDSLNPCLQALIVFSMQKSRVERFEVWLPDTEAPTIEVSYKSMHLNAHVWVVARSYFDEMPVGVFLPAHLDLRLAFESPKAAVEAVAYLLLNDMVHAFDSFRWDDEKRRGDLDHLARRLDVASRAGQASLAVLDDSIDAKSLLYASKLASRAYEVTQRTGSGDTPARVLHFEELIRERHLYGVPPVILPAIDPTPIQYTGVSG
jgi:hypothetical protein